jgi:hypothetical protein
MHTTGHITPREIATVYGKTKTGKATRDRRASSIPLNSQLIISLPSENNSMSTDSLSFCSLSFRVLATDYARGEL